MLISSIGTNLGFKKYRGFTTEWTVSGDATARTVTLPLVDVGVFNCTINWGDGTTTTIDAFDHADRAHTYAANGTYQVEITGECPSWSFNNAGDKLKISKIIYWGDTIKFGGFGYLTGGFYGCTNLTSLGTGKILVKAGLTNLEFCFAGLTNVALTVLPAGLFDNCVNLAASGCKHIFYSMAYITEIPADLFKYCTNLTTLAFQSAFAYCSRITTIPADLFKYNTGVTTRAFYCTFQSCIRLETIPSGLFDYNTEVTYIGFNSVFRTCPLLTAIPTDLFKYNTVVTTSAFQLSFFGCSAITSIPTDLFRYNISIGQGGFTNTFYGCAALTTVPTDTFRYNTLIAIWAFRSTFKNCTALATVPELLFKYNTAVSELGFYQTFQNCNKLQLNAKIFYDTGEQATRFHQTTIKDFTECFARDTFTGDQGVAPDLWLCDFYEYINVDVSPAVDWAADDIITGQTSGATAVVVAKIDALRYYIKEHDGVFDLDEIIGVTGNVDKLADQGATRPTFTRETVVTDCFGGAGNDATSISNYADIPAYWR